MKEQSKSEKDLVVTLEEGLQQEKQEYINKLRYNTNCCKQWIRCIRLIFLLELTLFFGWGCYMILQSYHSRVMENEVTDSIRERYLPVFESVSEVQKSHPTTKEMPVIFVKPEIITDKLNNFLGGIESSKEQGKTIVIDVDSIMPTSSQNSISMLSNNMVEASDINNSPMTSPSEDLVYNEEFMKNLMPWKIFSFKDSVNNKRFLEKLQNIAKLIEINDSEQFENSYDFTEDANRLTLNNQKDRALDTSNEIESLGLDVTTSVNLKDFMNFKINFDNSLRFDKDLGQRFPDLTKVEMQDDHGEKKNGFLEAWTDEQVNTSLESDLVICPPDQSSESSDMSSEHLITNPLISQSVSVPELLERIKNILSNDNTKNKDKHDADDSNMSMSTSSDAFASENDEHFAFDTQIPIVQNIQDHHLSEIIANTKEEEAKYNLMKNIESIDSEFLQPKIQDITESSTPNVKFQWFNAPPIFANDLQFGLKDISESSKTQNPSLEDTIENTETNTFIPGKDKSHIQCQTELKMNVLRIKCPEMMIDEEWNFTSSGIHVNNFLNVNNFKDNFSNMDDYNDDYNKDESKQSRDESISNENSDKKVASLQHSVPKVIDAVELQENMPVRSLKNAFDFTFKIDSFDRPEIDKHDEINSPDKEKIKQEISSSTTISSFTSEFDSDTVNLNKEWNPLLDIFDMLQQKQLKVTEEQDLLNSKNAETFLENNQRVYDLEKKLTSIFNDEILNIIKQQYLSESFSTDDYSDYICNISLNICSSSPNSWRQTYVDLKKFLEHVHDHDNPSDIGNDYNYRKKRMADDLTEQYEQVSNTLEEINKNVNVLQNLKKIFRRMEVFAACIDTLHERHLLNNKLDDDYVSNEFLMGTNEHRDSDINP